MIIKIQKQNCIISFKSETRTRLKSENARLALANFEGGI